MNVESASPASTPRTIVIVGGVAGGMSTATRLRRNLEHARIIVLERGPHVSYANCGLPYFAGGVITDRDELLLQTPESLAARFAIDVRVNTEATRFDAATRTLTARDTVSGAEYELEWDELVLAPGAAAVRPPIEGIERAHALRTVEDVDAITAALDSGPQSAAVLGAGFIGLEIAENLARRGLRVMVVERANQVLTPLDVELAQLVREELERNGVSVRTGAGATQITSDAVQLEDGTSIPADIVIAAVGVRPESSLARDAGLALTEQGGIVVDAQMRTSQPHVYAVGDAVAKVDALSAEAVLVPLAQTANRHGRLVADVIAGRVSAAALSTMGTAIVGVFDLTVALVGWNERRLRAAGRAFEAISTHPFNHATYYPGAEQMSLKLLVDPDSFEILGAQAVGGAGVDKRIDVIATAMRAGLAAHELADLELAYSPQYGAAKDPINMLGFIADNVRERAIRLTQWHEVDELQRAGAVVLDARSAGEHETGAIPGATNIPVNELRERAGELPDDTPIVVYCATGPRANVAARLLTALGHDARILSGSYATWRAGTASQRHTPAAYA